MKVCGSCGLVCEDGGHLADDAATVWASEQIRDFNSDYFIHTLLAARSSTSSSRPSVSHTRQSPIKPGATIALPSAKIARLGIDLSALDRSLCLSPPRSTLSSPEKLAVAPRAPRLPAAQQPDKSRSLRECLSEMAALCRRFDLPRDVQSEALNRLADVHPYFKQRPLCTQLLHTAACLQLVCKSLRPPRKLSLVALVQALPSAPLAPDPSLLHSVLVETHKFLLLVDTRIASLQPPAAEPLIPLDVSDDSVGFLHENSDQNFIELVEHLECLYNRAIDENALPVRPTRVTLQNAKRLLRVLHALSRSASSDLSRHTLPTRSFAMFAFYNAYLHTALRTPTSTSASTSTSSSTSTASAQHSLERTVAAGGSAGGTRGPLLKSRAGRAPRRNRKHRLPAPPLSQKQFATRLRVRSAAAGGHDVLRRHASMLLRALQAELARRSTQLLEALGLARLPAEQFEARLPLCLGDLLDTLNVDARTPFVVRAEPPAAQATETTAAIRDDADVSDEECDGDEELDESEIDTYLRTDDEIKQYLACENESDQR